MLKSKTFFAHPITKPPASTLEFKSFDSILQKNFYDFRQKLEKRPHQAGSSCAWVTSTLNTSRSFPDFFETQCWQP